MKQDTVTLIPNGNGAQPYLSAHLLEDSGCPLPQGAECTVEVVDGIGLLITRVHETREFRVVEDV